jgi:hypothetical protein
MTSAQSLDFVLCRVRQFVDTLWWAPEEYLDAMTLVLAVTHAKDAFTSVPYVLITSDKPKTGKTTASTHVPLLLADMPWEVNSLTTEPAVRAKFMDRVPPSAIVMPDIGKIFGESGLNGRTSKVYQLLIGGYVRNGKIEVSVNRVSTQVPAYFVAFLDGLNNAVPADLATRCIKMRVTAKPSGIRKRDALSPGVAKEAEPLRTALHRTVVSRRKDMQKFLLGKVLGIHEKLVDRDLQTWGPLFAVADAAGGEWPARCLSAFLELALDASDKPQVLLDQQCLLDVAGIAVRSGASVLFTGELTEALRELPSGQYLDIDDNDLASYLLPQALGPAQEMTGPSLDGTRVLKGMARKVAPVLRAAAALRRELYPPAPAAGPSALERELALEEVAR